MCWNESCQRYYAYVGNRLKGNFKGSSFSPDKYGGSRPAALRAALAWRKRTKDPRQPSYGRKLSLEQAGCIYPNYTADGKLRAYIVALSHDSIRLNTSFGALTDPAAALQKAELMLECYREEMRRYTRLTAAQQRALRWA